MKYLVILAALFTFSYSSNAKRLSLPLAQVERPKHIVSGPLEAAHPGLVYEKRVGEPGVGWMRVRFDLKETVLPPFTQIKLVSQRDGHEQVFPDIQTLRQWNGASAFFNGDEVKVQVYSDARFRLAIQPAIAIKSVITDPLPSERPFLAPEYESICGTEDKRTPSNFSRDGRMLPIGCSVWIIDDAAHCMLTAGHCNEDTQDAVIEFQVPLTLPDGTLVHPDPKDQYKVDPASIVATKNVQRGDDWMYFGVFPNPVTNLTAFEAQQECYTLHNETSINVAELGQIQISGYGYSANRTYSQVQQVHVGNFTEVDQGSLDVLKYVVDTMPGNSGGAVLDLKSGHAIGIHTNGGCTRYGGSNAGTPLYNKNLQEALKNPKGVCQVL